jgi:hypothetical protein
MLPPVTHERRDVGVHLVGLPRIEVAEDVGQLGAVVRGSASASYGLPPSRSRISSARSPARTFAMVATVAGV